MMQSRDSQVHLRAAMDVNESAINPNESEHFMNANEHQSIFGTGNIGPDRIRLSMANMRQNGLAQGVPATAAESGLLENLDQYD